ncbi:type VI secretion system baseplate subunit TssK [Arenibaculum pallidiluteum]|uniref:type VI secretion system baseplate subunit TssK n=1 Tax=Arenibaculum pallidiluteum TaxID=2812559 RepID=UPI001A960CE1|nr:type VI secretion system baseplate subunit TssK [Arenibaculum pallidiluteum]
MTGIRDVPDPIQWHEGMLLAPQHFQQEALRTQAMVAAHMGLAGTFHWGVVHLLLDRVALVSGLVRILELEAVMPDGLIVWHDSTAPAPLELDISGHADPLAQAPLTIHLAVPAARSGSWGGAQRWQSVEGRPVLDENGGDELSIPRLRPRLSLVVTAQAGERPPQRYVSMPLARIAFANDAFALTEFAPPSLAVTANSPVGRLCADVARRLREKAMLLSERMGAGAGRDGGDVSPFDEVRALVVGLPPLEAQLAVEACHPFQVYLSMAGLAGHVSALAAGAIPPKLSRYDHDDPLPAFAEIRDFIARMVERVREVAEPIRFTFEDGMFGLEMREEWLRGKLLIGVRGPAGMPTADVVAWIENAVIASRPRLEKLAALRVTGAVRAVVDNTGEAGVTPPRGTVLFTVEKDPDLILAGERLEIWNPDNLGSRQRPADVALYVLT